MKSTLTNRLLVVRLDNIGDFVLWINSAQLLKELFTEKHITLIGNNAWTDLAKKFNCWDKIWELNRTKFSNNIIYRISFLRKVKKAGFQIVIQPRISRELLFEDAIVKASCAPTIVGAKGDCSNIFPMLKAFSDRFYNRLIDAEEPLSTELERNAHFISNVGKSGYKLKCPTIPPLTIEKKFFPDKPYVILFPGAGFNLKMWPLSSFARFAEKIIHGKNLIFIVCGGPEDIDRATKLARLCHGNGIEINNFAGKTTLLELVELIRNASLLVSNDTSAIHIAAAVSTSSVCILGGGHFGRFLPYPDFQDFNSKIPIPIYHRMPCYGCNWTCIFDVKKGCPAPCIKKITVSQVVDAAEKLLKKLGN